MKTNAGRISYRHPTDVVTTKIDSKSNTRDFKVLSVGKPGILYVNIAEEAFLGRYCEMYSSPVRSFAADIQNICRA